MNLDAAKVPLVAGELMDAEQKGACASMNPIIDDLPKTIPNSGVASSKGCIGRPDHLHFTPAGYRLLGTRYAEAMLPLLVTNSRGSAIATYRRARQARNVALHHSYDCLLKESTL